MQRIVKLWAHEGHIGIHYLVDYFHILWSYLCHCVHSCMFCRLLFNFVNYVLLLLCICIRIVTFMYMKGRTGHR